MTLSQMKFIFWTRDVFCRILPEKRHILAPPVQKKLNGKKCDDSAGTETCCSLPVSDLSIISEAWSGKVISAKTDPHNREKERRRKGEPALSFNWGINFLSINFLRWTCPFVEVNLPFCLRVRAKARDCTLCFVFGIKTWLQIRQRHNDLQQLLRLVTEFNAQGFKRREPRDGRGQGFKCKFLSVKDFSACRSPSDEGSSFKSNEGRISSRGFFRSTYHTLSLVGCNNGGGGGNFSKVKRLVAKWVAFGTRKRLFSSFFEAVCDFRNVGTFSQGILYS